MNPFGAMIVFNITFKGFKNPWFVTPNNEDRISSTEQVTAFQPMGKQKKERISNESDC